VVHPKAFADAELVGDTLMRPKPVVLDLRGLDVMLTRRFIDFSSGLTYGLKATAERISDGVFLLQPKDVRLDDQQRRVINDQL
jgi:cell division inhibitor SepF